MKAAETTTIRDVTVTRLGLGTAPLGGLFTPVRDDDAASTIDAAWSCGLRLFDTAPLYGYGNAERRLGCGLARRPRTESVRHDYDRVFRGRDGGTIGGPL